MEQAACYVVRPVGVRDPERGPVVVPSLPVGHNGIPGHEDGVRRLFLLGLHLCRVCRPVWSTIGWVVLPYCLLHYWTTGAPTHLLEEPGDGAGPRGRQPHHRLVQQDHVHLGPGTLVTCVAMLCLVTWRGTRSRHSWGSPQHCCNGQLVDWWVGPLVGLLVCPTSWRSWAPGWPQAAAREGWTWYTG